MTVRAAAGLALVALGAACGRPPAVERAYDGRVIDGRFIEADAYAAFLRGAMAEAGGDLPSAVAAYTGGARSDPGGPEIWARIGAVRCAADPRDGRADDAFARAIRLDPAYAGTWAEKAKCAMARGESAGARAAAARAVTLDPAADEAGALVASSSPEEEGKATRAFLVALTVTARDRRVAWSALAAWTRRHDEIALWASALKELARLSPAERDAMAAAAEELAGIGEWGEAMAVAAAAADADVLPLSDGRALAARLALDQAIGGGDVSAVKSRATRVRVSLEETAARALLAGKRLLARELAAVVAGADPAALGARLVLAASTGADLLGAANVACRCDPVSAAAFVAFGVALASAAPPERSRAVLASVAHAPLVVGDDRVVRPAVLLASRGLISARTLPPDGGVELAALCGDAPPAGATLPGVRGLDDRHVYLDLALAGSNTSRTREIAARFTRVGLGDPVVAAARALMLLASGEAIAASASRELLARDPSDPLLAAAALRLAERVGDANVAGRARAALVALRHF